MQIIHKIPKSLYKKKISPSIRMSGKSINFDDKKSAKVIFRKTRKYKICDISIHLNTSLDIMMIMSLDQYL